MRGAGGYASNLTGTNGQISHIPMASGYCVPALPSVASVSQQQSCWLGTWCLQISTYLGIGTQHSALTMLLETLTTPLFPPCQPNPFLWDHMIHSVVNIPHIPPCPPFPTSSPFGTKFEEQPPLYPPFFTPLPPTSHPYPSQPKPTCWSPSTHWPNSPKSSLVSSST